LSINPATAAEAGSYDVVVSGTCSPPVISNPASLTVNSCSTLAPMLISEFRLHGSGGAQDEFIELYNNSDTPADISGYTLFALTAGGTQTLVFTVPGALGSNSTVVPARGHYLIANSNGYSLGALAVADGTYTTDIVDGSGVALFGSAVPASGNRVDSVGFDNRDALFFEGTPLAPAGGIIADGEYSFVRQFQANGLPQDTDDNATDFVFISTTAGLFSGRSSVLGAPGPEDLASPIMRNLTVAASLVDPLAPAIAAPNRTRDVTSDPANNSTFGTLTFRRHFTNNTGAPVTQLRLRIVNITTLPNPAGTADLRGRSTVDAVVSLTGGGSVMVHGTTLQSPTQLLGGGLNSTLNAGVITLATPLAPGASVDVQFMVGVQSPGVFRFFVNVEAK